MAATLEAPVPAEAPTDRLVTAQELLQHPEWGPCELVRGKVIPVCRPNVRHGKMITTLASKLDQFAISRNLGEVISGDSGVWVERDPDTVRGPDIFFVARERWPSPSVWDGFLTIAPDICIEIVSPNDKWSELQSKVDTYLDIGVKLVWIIDPALRNARVYRPSVGMVTIPKMECFQEKKHCLGSRCLWRNCSQFWIDEFCFKGFFRMIALGRLQIGLGATIFLFEYLDDMWRKVPLLGALVFVVSVVVIGTGIARMSSGFTVEYIDERERKGEKNINSQSN